MVEENKRMKCAECEREFLATELSPGVIDHKLQLVCPVCWEAAVRAGRATIYTQKELSAFSEFE